MAVTEYQKGGLTLFRVAVKVRSKSDRRFCVQKSRFGIESFKEARSAEQALNREALRELIEREVEGQSWGAVVGAFETYLEGPEAKHLHETTRTEYVATVKKHTRAWWKRPAAEIKRGDLRKLFTEMTEQGFSLSHIKKMKIVINRVFVHAIDNRLISGVDQSPTIGIQLGREEEVVPEILTLGEIRKLLKLAREMDHKWYYHWALALLTGMRTGELYALLWTDIDWDNGSILVSKSFCSRTKTIKCTKSGTYRTVPISSDLKSLLLEIRAQAGTRESVLPRLWVWTQGLQAGELRKFCKGVGLPSIRFHTLRACFATQLIQNGVAPILIQKICGWKDLKTMQRYIRLAGIEVKGATEELKVLPESEVAAKVVNLFTRESVESSPE